MTEDAVFVKVLYREEDRIRETNRGLAGIFTIKVKRTTKLKRIYEGVKKHLKSTFTDDPSAISLRVDYKNTGVKCIIPEVGTLETLESQKLIDLSPGAAQEIEAFLPSTNTNRKKRKRQGDDREQKSSKQQKKSTLQPLSRDDIVAGKYKIQKKLGEGTFSVVYVVFEAWCPSAIISIVSLYHVSITSLKSQLSIFTLSRLRHRPTQRSNVTNTGTAR